MVDRYKVYIGIIFPYSLLSTSNYMGGIRSFTMY